MNIFVKSIPHLLKKKKKRNCAFQPELDDHNFFDFLEKRKQVHGKYSVHDIFCITIYRSTNCTCKSKFQTDVTQFPQCRSHIEMIVLLSALFLLMGNQHIASIVGLIQIHVASLEPSWLSMLHNRVDLSWSDIYSSFLFNCWELLTHVHLMELFSMGLRYR